MLHILYDTDGEFPSTQTAVKLAVEVFRRGLSLVFMRLQEDRRTPSNFLLRDAKETQFRGRRGLAMPLTVILNGLLIHGQFVPYHVEEVS